MTGINFKGMDDLDTDSSIYCDHFHLYSFLFGGATPASSSDSVAEDLMLYGITMIGFPDACTFDETFGVHYELEQGVEYATTGDQFVWTCGWYVQVDWSGDRGLYIENWSKNAIINAVTAFAMLTTSALLM